MERGGEGKRKRVERGGEKEGERGRGDRGDREGRWVRRNGIKFLFTTFQLHVRHFFFDGEDRGDERLEGVRERRERRGEGKLYRL